VCHRLLIRHPPTTPCGSTYRWSNGTSAVASARAKEETAGGGRELLQRGLFSFAIPPPSSRFAPSPLRPLPPPSARDVNNSVFLSIYLSFSLSLSVTLSASSSLLSHEITDDRYGPGENAAAHSPAQRPLSLFPFASSLTRFSQSTHPRTAAEREFSSQPSDPDSRDVSDDSYVSAFFEHFPRFICFFFFSFFFSFPSVFLGHAKKRARARYPRVPPGTFSHNEISISLSFSLSFSFPLRIIRPGKLI